MPSLLQQVFPSLVIVKKPIEDAVTDFSKFNQPTSVACQVRMGHYPNQIEPHVIVYHLENGIIQEVCKPQATMTLLLLQAPTTPLEMEYMSAFIAVHVLNHIKSTPSASQQIFIRGGCPAEIDALRQAFLCLVPAEALSFRTAQTYGFFQSLPLTRSSPTPSLLSLLQVLKPTLPPSYSYEAPTQLLGG